MSARINPVINIDDCELIEMGHGDHFGAKLGLVGDRIGAKALGCLLTIVPPGKSAFPFHVHHANEEMFIILEGQGKYRFGSQNYDVKAGDILAAPAGGPEYAHRLTNCGTSPLKYLGISTKNQPEIVEYPDSGKFMVMSQSPTGNPRDARLRFIGRTNSTLEYWDGEEE